MSDVEDRDGLGLASTGATEPAGPTESTEPAEQARAPRVTEETLTASRWTMPPRVLWLGYRTAATNLGAPLAATVTIFVPVAALTVAALVSGVGRDAAIINGELRLDGLPSLPALTVVAGALLLVAMATAVAVAACASVAAGALLGRPVGWRAALRAVVRRCPTLAGLLAVGIGVAALAGVASFGVLLLLSRVWIALTVGGVIVLALTRFALALPLAVLEGRGVFAALGRAYLVSRGRTGTTVAALLLGTLGIPLLAELALRFTLSPLDGLAHTVAWETLRVALVLVLIPFQAAVLTILALRGRTVDDTNQGAAYLDGVAARLPEPAGLPTRTRSALPRTALLVAALVVPGLLYGGYVWANPLRLVVADQHEISTDPVHPLTVFGAGADRPLVVDGPPTSFVDLYGCGDPECAESTMLGELSWPIAHTIATAMLPDGSLAMVAWEDSSDLEEGKLSSRLAVFACQPETCGEKDIESATTVERATTSRNGAALAMAATPEGLVIVRADPTGLRAAALRLTRCADIRCADPRTATLARVRQPVPARMARPLAVTLDRANRPVIAYLDTRTGAIAVITCDTPGCADPTIHTPVGPVLEREVDAARNLVGVDLAVDRQGRPILAYRHFRTGAAMLLTCTSRDCAQAEETRLSGPGGRRPYPRIALDAHDHPLVATYDVTGRELVMVVCEESGCRERTTVPLAGVERGFGHLDVAVGADGRPSVVWADQLPEKQQHPFAEDQASLRMITCVDRHCRPGLSAGG